MAWPVEGTKKVSFVLMLAQEERSWSFPDFLTNWLQVVEVVWLVRPLRLEWLELLLFWEMCVKQCDDTVDLVYK